MITVNVVPPSPAGIAENNKNEAFYIFPNPTSTQLTLVTDGTKGLLKIFNTLGETVISQTITGQKTEINVAALPKGIYFIEAPSGNTIERSTFIKE